VDNLQSTARRLFWPALVLGVSLAIFQFSDIDLAVQDRVYALGARGWPITKADSALRLIFYNGPKIVLAVFGAGLAIALLGSFWNRGLARIRRRLAFVLVVLALVPSLAALGKAVTHVYCPSQLERYGGAVPYVRLFDRYPDSFVAKKPGRCFPAGHASGGFALMALFFAFKRRRRRVAGLTLGLGLGWLMGGYQTLIGAHYLSHTVATMLLAWIVCVLLEPLILRSPRRQ